MSVVGTGKHFHFVFRFVGFAVAVLDKQHRDKTQRYENRAVGEQYPHRAERLHKVARQYRRYNLRSHAGGVVVPRVFADGAAFGKFHDHRETVYVYRRPCDACQCKQHDEQPRRTGSRHENRAEKCRRKQCDTD